MATMTMVTRFGIPALVIMAMGCGGGASGPKLAPVTGKVTVGGSAPFKAGLVRFIPAPGANLNSREATTDAEGNYKIEFFPGQPGLQPGAYTVMFSLYQMPDGSTPPDQTKSVDPKHPTDLGAAQMVPPQFETGKDPKCAVTVDEKGGKFDFDLPELKAQSTGKKTAKR